MSAQGRDVDVRVRYTAVLHMCTYIQTKALLSCVCVRVFDACARAEVYGDGVE